MVKHDLSNTSFPNFLIISVCQIPATLLRVVSLLGIKADPDADIVPRTIMIGGKVCPHQLVHV